MNVLSVASGMLAQAADSDQRLHIGLIAWLIIGLVAGFIASKTVNKTGEGVFLDIVLGLVGSFVGGLLFHLMGFHRDGSIIFSIIVATLGAILVLVVYHKLIGGGRRTAP